jgi:CMP-N,N'-diacetyllegionaminic acid synthase
MKIFAVIPARGGSKGLPRKNIRPLGGKPLIAWTIEQALKVKEIDQLICSTDDHEIANVAQSFGCDVPFMRPKKLAGDFIPGAEVTIDAIEYFERQGERFDTALHLQCTCPFRTCEDIESAIEKYRRESAQSLVSVCALDYPLEWMYTVSEEGKLREIAGESDQSPLKQRQRFEKIFRPNGAIYLCDADLLKMKRTLINSESIAFEMTKRHSLDIDDETDLEIANLICSAERKQA